MTTVQGRKVFFGMLCAVAVVSGLFPGAVSAATATCEGTKATIVGTRRSDRLKGTPRADVIVGKGGNDVIEGLGRGDKICGGRGDDTLVGNRGGDWLIGGPGEDDIGGNRGADRLDGNEDDDYFNIGTDPGHDVIDGGEGLRDFIDASFPSRDGDPEGGTEAALIDLSIGTATTERGDTDDLVLLSIEAVYGSGIGDTIVGDEAANELISGYNGGGRIEGRGGDDLLSEGQDGGTEFYGGAGDDVIEALLDTEGLVDGGEGSDTLSFDAPSTIDLAAGTATADYETTTLVSIENVRGGGGEDRISGDDGPNVLDGGLYGDDVLEGRGGDDILIGGDGTDDGDGGDGTDTCTDDIENRVSCES